jgi:putative oxidoreductase
MRTFATWALSALLAFAFLSSGVMKLMGHPMEEHAFQSFGYPLWFMYVIGLLEIAGAILVLVPRVAYVGAGLLACVMVGAVFSHLTHGQAAMTPVPLVLLLIALAAGTLRGWGEQKERLHIQEIS